MGPKSASLVEIYALCDATGIRYVGKSTNAEKRFLQHLRDARTGRRSFPVHCWIRSLDVLPTLRVLARVHPNHWQDAEKSAIAILREAGVRLLNVADGGDEPGCSLEVRQQNGRKVAKMRESDPLAKRVWEIKRAMSSALKAGFVSNEARAKLRLAAEKRPDLFGLWATLEDV